MGTAAKPIRENRTITVDFRNEATYFQLLGDGKAFLECVMAFILSIGFQLKHKATCGGGGCLTRHSHYVRVRLGDLTIWRLQGFVANFAQEVVKGQLPLSVEGIRRPGSRTVRPQCGPRFP